MRCNACFAENPDGAKRCVRCEAVLADEASPPVSPVDAATLSHPRQAGAAGDAGAAQSSASAGGPTPPHHGVVLIRQGDLLVGQYRVLDAEPIGSGGMGEVWRAQDTELGTTVAIKVLPRIFSRDKAAIELLRQETLLGQQLAHPNVCRLFGLHSAGELRFIVMEYVQGKTLSQLLVERPDRRMTWAEVEPMARQVAGALDFAHQAMHTDATGRVARGVLHRDVKPANIMVTTAGGAAVAKLMDFGIACEIHNTMTRITGATSMTPLYASPEQYRGDGLTTAADIYSFAAVLYECLAGHPHVAPHGDMAYQVTQKPYSPIGSVSEEVNIGLEAGLSKDPVNRPPTATELVNWCVDPPRKVRNRSKKLKRDRGTTAATKSKAALAAQPASSPIKAASTHAMTMAKAQPAESARPGSSGPVGVGRFRLPRRRLAIAGGAVAATVLVGLGIWAIVHSRPGGDDRAKLPGPPIATGQSVGVDIKPLPGNLAPQIDLSGQDVKVESGTHTVVKRFKDHFIMLHNPAMPIPPLSDTSYGLGFTATFSKLTFADDSRIRWRIEPIGDAKKRCTQWIKCWPLFNGHTWLSPHIDDYLPGKMVRFADSNGDLGKAGYKSSRTPDSVALAAWREDGVYEFCFEKVGSKVNVWVGTTSLFDVELPAEPMAQANGLPIQLRFTQIAGNPNPGAKITLLELTTGKNLPPFQPPDSTTRPATITETGKTTTVDLGGGVTMKLAYIPAGTFMMGATKEKVAAIMGKSAENPEDWAFHGETPPHQVTLTKPYYAGVTEVTQAQWKAVMGTTFDQVRAKRPAGEPGSNGGKPMAGDEYPMSYVSWDDAAEFCRQLSARTGRTFRLPTEAEWEYAARAGSEGPFGFAESVDKVGDYAWTNGNCDGNTHPVGQLKPNAWGLYDVLGNVSEWTADDFYVPDLWANGLATTNPAKPPENEERTVNRRGSAVSTMATYHRVSGRDGYGAKRNAASDVTGFRVVTDATGSRPVGTPAGPSVAPLPGNLAPQIDLAGPDVAVETGVRSVHNSQLKRFKDHFIVLPDPAVKSEADGTGPNVNIAATFGKLTFADDSRIRWRIEPIGDAKTRGMLWIKCWPLPNANANALSMGIEDSLTDKTVRFFDSSGDLEKAGYKAYGTPYPVQLSAFRDDGIYEFCFEKVGHKVTVWAGPAKLFEADLTAEQMTMATGMPIKLFLSQVVGKPNPGAKITLLELTIGKNLPPFQPAASSTQSAGNLTPSPVLPSMAATQPVGGVQGVDVKPLPGNLAPQIDLAGPDVEVKPGSRGRAFVNRFKDHFIMLPDPAKPLRDGDSGQSALTFEATFSKLTFADDSRIRWRIEPVGNPGTREHSSTTCWPLPYFDNMGILEDVTFRVLWLNDHDDQLQKSGYKVSKTPQSVQRAAFRGDGIYELCFEKVGNRLTVWAGTAKLSEYDLSPEQLAKANRMPIQLHFSQIFGKPNPGAKITLLELTVGKNLPSFQPAASPASQPAGNLTPVLVQPPVSTTQPAGGVAGVDVKPLPGNMADKIDLAGPEVKVEFGGINNPAVTRFKNHLIVLPDPAGKPDADGNGPPDDIALTLGKLTFADDSRIRWRIEPVGDATKRHVQQIACWPLQIVGKDRYVVFLNEAIGIQDSNNYKKVFFQDHTSQLAKSGWNFRETPTPAALAAFRKDGIYEFCFEKVGNKLTVWAGSTKLFEADLTPGQMTQASRMPIQLFFSQGYGKPNPGAKITLLELTTGKNLPPFQPPGSPASQPEGRP